MDATATQSPYFFPLLKNTEILTCLTATGIELTNAELVEPHRHKEKVRAVFDTLVDLGLNLTEEESKEETTKESKQKPIPSTILTKQSQLPYTNLHNESIPELSTFLSHQKFMYMCGISDFGWMDLMSPTSKRWRKQLSGAINFLRFKEDRVNELYLELFEQRQELVDGYTDVLQEHGAIEKQVETANQDADVRWDDLKQVRDECMEVEMEIGQQNKLQASIRQESLELKREWKGLKDSLATTSLGTQEAETELRVLMPQVVEDPDLVMKEFENAKEIVMTLEQEIDDGNDIVQEMEQKMENAEVCQKDLTLGIRLIEEVQREQTKYDTLLEEANDVEGKVQDLQGQISSVDEELAACQAELSQIESTNQSNSQQFKSDLDTAIEELQSLNLNLNSLERGRNDAMDRLEAAQEEVKVLEQLIQDEERQATQEVEYIIAKFRVLEKSFIDNQEMMFASIKVN